MSFKHTMDRMWRLITDKHLRFQAKTYFGMHDKLSDEEYLRRRYKVFCGKELNLENPQTLNEKLNWIKLYDRNPKYTMMVDKYEVKKYVADLIGDEHVIPTLGVWDKFEDIDFDSLPDKFVIKCTHDSGGVVLCKDKKKFNKRKARKLINRHLKKNYFYTSREWPYKNVKPRIIAEPFIDGLGAADSVEYKIGCADGQVKFIAVCTGKAHDALSLRKNDIYSPNYEEKYDFYVYYKPSGIRHQKPVFHDEMIDICEKLSKDIPEVRVDLYVNNGKIYFGELTFFTWGGFCKFVPEEWDLKLGGWIKLPNKSE